MTSRSWARSGRSWSAALRDLSNDRAARAVIREERLRSTAGLRGSPALALSAWRGRSGRRYVVGVHDLAEPDFAEIGEAVVIAVRRDAAGIAEPVSAAVIGRSPRERLTAGWATRMRDAGASELHVHRLAESETERRAIVEDLTDAEPGPVAPADRLGGLRSAASRLAPRRRGLPADAVRDRGRGRTGRQVRPSRLD